MFNDGMNSILTDEHATVVRTNIHKIKNCKKKKSTQIQNQEQRSQPQQDNNHRQDVDMIDKKKDVIDEMN